MKGIHVDPARSATRAQAGVTVGELDRATAAFGLATPSGVVSSTGIAGLTLGGGIAWLMGKYGMAIDNLLSAEVVLASGAVVTASDDTDPDLYWALRGGGGNFGVVTSFEYHTHPLASVLGGPVLHPLAAAPQLFSFYRDFAADLPDELSTQAVFLHAPDGSGTKLCGIAVCHAGDDTDRAEADVRPLRQFGSPAADMIQRMPYPVMNTGVDWLSPAGALSYWKSAFFSTLSDAAVELLTRAFERAPSELCALVVEDFHGAVTRVASTATAYPHREPGYNLFLISQWTDPAQTDTGIAWARETFDALSPYMADRSYTNYLSADDYDRVRQAYGPNYERLVELKRRYDPGQPLPAQLQHRPQRLMPVGALAGPDSDGNHGSANLSAGHRRTTRPALERSSLPRADAGRRARSRAHRDAALPDLQARGGRAAGHRGHHAAAQRRRSPSAGGTLDHGGGAARKS